MRQRPGASARNRLVAWMLHFSVASTFALAGQAVAATSPDDVVRAWLQQQLQNSDEGRDDARFSLGWADLDGNGRKEAFVYLEGPGRCGSGGCDMYILQVRGTQVHMLANTSVTRLPVAVLPTRSHGYHDVAVRVCGGGILQCYDARLRFDGRGYPDNPSMVPAVGRGSHGVTVLRLDDPSRSVFVDEVPRTLAEFGLSASFPKGRLVCDSLSGDHLVGWYMPLDGGCDEAGRRVSVWASYNASFYASPRDVGDCAGQPAGQMIGARIPRAKSWGCRVDYPDGTVVLAATAQAGEWPNDPGDTGPEWRTPHMNYEVALHSDLAHLDEDARAFSQVFPTLALRAPAKHALGRIDQQKPTRRH